MNHLRSIRSSDRAVHLIDAENLVGSGRLAQSDVMALRDSYLDSVPVGPRDQLVIATAHNSLLSVGTAWPGLRYQVRSGKDGADICLARIIVDEHLEDRFAKVYLGSGDGGLAPFAAYLAGRGTDVVAVSRRRALSAQMRLATSGVIFIDEPRSAAVAVAA